MAVRLVEGIPSSRVLRSGWPSYIAYLALPAILVFVGGMANMRAKFGLIEYIVFFAIPGIAAVLAIAKLVFCRVEFCGDQIVLGRLVIAKLHHQVVSIAAGDLLFGSLSNRVRGQSEIRRRSGLVFVPISVLYLEYRNGEKTAKIAFDVSSLDNQALRSACVQQGRILVAGYGDFPRP